MINGKRMNFRPLSVDDLPRRLEMINDPLVQRQTVGDTLDATSETDLMRWFEMVSDDPFSEQWAIITQEEGYVGDVDLHSVGVLGPEAWISPMVGNTSLADDPAFRRELLSLVAHYAFEQKRVGKVCIDLPDTDAAGIEALEALGFNKVDELEMDPITGVRTLTYEVTPEALRSI